MNRVLYISYDGLTDPLGQSQIFPYLQKLRGHGYHITILSFEKPDRYKQVGGEIKQLCFTADIDWVPLTYHKRPAVFSTLYDLWVLRTVIRKLQARQPFVIVHCRSYISALGGLWMKRKFKTKFIFDMRGFWADERVDGKIWNLFNPVYRTVYRYFKRKEREFLREADWTITLTESARAEINKWQSGALRISVIPTCVDLQLFDPGRISTSQRIEMRAKLGFGPDDFVLIYLGSWGTWYGTAEMLAFFRELRDKNRSAKFLIVTPDKPGIDDESIKIVHAAREEVPLLIALSDLAIFFIKPSYSKMASSATKLGEILAMNVALVTNRGWGDIEAYQKLLPDEISFESTPVKRDLQGTGRGREFCFNHLSLEMGVAGYAEIYRQLCDQTDTKA